MTPIATARNITRNSNRDKSNRFDKNKNKNKNKNMNSKDNGNDNRDNSNCNVNNMISEIFNRFHHIFCVRAPPPISLLMDSTLAN